MSGEEPRPRRREQRKTQAVFRKHANRAFPEAGRKQIGEAQTGGNVVERWEKKKKMRDVPTSREKKKRPETKTKEPLLASRQEFVGSGRSQKKKAFPSGTFVLTERRDNQKKKKLLAIRDILPLGEGEMGRGSRPVLLKQKEVEKAERKMFG